LVVGQFLTGSLLVNDKTSLPIRFTSTNQSGVGRYASRITGAFTLRYRGSWSINPPK
jgi:hypothetical protein